MALSFHWRGDFDNAEVNELHAEAFGHRVLEDDWQAQSSAAQPGLGLRARRRPARRLRQRRVGWRSARLRPRHDGPSRSRPAGIGTELVAISVAESRAAGCEWLHVDFDDHLREFYFDACGFEPTNAGLIKL